MASKPIPHLLLTLFLTLGTLTNLSHSRPIVSFHSKIGLLSDGINIVNYTNSFPLLLPKNGWVFSSESCEQTYGFLPCTTTVFGNLFLILVYGYLMFTAATFLSNGSEMLLEILGPGIIGGLFLPVLGALPDALLILVSGLSGSKETAQSQVLVGMGLLAGSTVMLLTLLWGSCIIVGKCDLEDSHAVDQKNTKGFSLTGSGVSTDIWTTYAAMIMAASVIPFVIVQLPQIFHTSAGKRVVVLIALIAAVTLLLSYCIYQVFQPWIQERKLAFAKHKLIMSGILKHLKQHALGRLFTDDGEPNTDVIRKLFKAIDENSDERLSPAELRALVLGIRFEEIDLDQEDAVAKVLKDFDTSGDSFVDEEEFVVGISKWLREAKRTVASNAGAESAKFMHEYHQQTKKEHDLLGNHGDDGAESIQDPKWTTIKAVLMLILGTAVAAAFADPLVDAVDNFSSATSIPSFFISFIVLPLATNSSEAVSAIIFASRKKQRTASLTFSEIYGAATMNNLLCLAVFLALVYVRHLTWDFSAEVLIILIVCIVMGVFGSLRTTFPLWTCSIAYALYPLSLVLVYVLDYIFGWS